jgi:hypothetical protein
VLAELANRGLAVVNADDHEWSVDVASLDGSGHEQLWREDRMAALLASDLEPLVVGGCASNQARFYDRFDAVVLLSVPVDVMRERVATRTTNDFGKGPVELARILVDLETIEPLLRATSTVEIVTTAPIADVVDSVEALARGLRAD